MTTVVEGVEEQEQLDFLRAHGCPLAPGLPARPAGAGGRADALAARHGSRRREGGRAVTRTLPEVAARARHDAGSSSPPCS